MKIRIIWILASAALLWNCSPQSDGYELVWSDEFDYSGKPDTAKWFLETQAPDNGSWYNGELQHYTDRLENAEVKDGQLRIIAKKETFTSSGTTKEYTSARFNSRKPFTYGRVEVRAKLPAAAGTWPAIWALGSNIGQVGWPACGEIDIMEQLFENHLMVQCAIHVPSRFGAEPDLKQTPVTDVTKNFHVYGMDWQKDRIDFTVDGKIYHTYSPAEKNDGNWPFNKPQFLLLNIAMGGNLGGTVDPNFTQDVMEVDYVRVYQKR